MQILKDEITNDPLTRGYSGMTDQQISDNLNKVDRTNIGSITPSMVLKWSADSTNAEQPRILKLEAGESNADDSLKAISKVILIMIKRGEIDMGLVGTLVSGDVLSDGDNAALIAEATENISRATELGLVNVRPGTVQMARI